MRSIRVLRNILTNYLRFFVTGALGFVLTPLMVRLLGDGRYGLWVTIFSVTGYFGLVDQGIRPSLVRYVSRDHTRGDLDGLSRTVSSALALYSGAGLLTLAVTGVVAVGFPVWFHLASADVGIARVTLLLAGTSLAIGFPFGVFGATLSGLQRYDIANAIGVGISIARAVLFVVVLKLGGGIVGLAWASLAMNLAGHLLSWVFARRLLPGLRVGRDRITRSHLALVGSYSSIALIGALANSITFQTDSLVITAFMSAAAVTPFALAAGLVDNVRTLVYSATWVLSPTASEFETRGEAGKLHEMMITGSRYSVLLAWPVLLGLVVFGRNFMTTWVGHRYEEAAGLLTVLAVPTLLSLPQSTTSSVLFGISRHKGVVALSILNALLNLGLSLLWVKPLGLMGVALGTAIPLGLVGGIATMLYGCHALALPLARYTWEGLVRPGLVCLAFVIPALVAQWLLHPIGWLPLAGVCGGCWAVFAACAWRFGIVAEDRQRWSRMVPGLFGRTATAGVTP